MSLSKQTLIWVGSRDVLAEGDAAARIFTLSRFFDMYREKWGEERYEQALREAGLTTVEYRSRATIAATTPHYREMFEVLQSQGVQSLIDMAWEDSAVVWDTFATSHHGAVNIWEEKATVYIDGQEKPVPIRQAEFPERGAHCVIVQKTGMEIVQIRSTASEKDQTMSAIENLYVAGGLSAINRALTVFADTPVVFYASDQEASSFTLALRMDPVASTVNTSEVWAISPDGRIKVPLMQSDLASSGDDRVASAGDLGIKSDSEKMFTERVMSTYDERGACTFWGLTKLGAFDVASRELEVTMGDMENLSFLNSLLPPAAVKTKKR
ncbi:MAG: hypothetical protein IKZ87_04340 [Actinomycetaceae bacterium]|nr:hypothetical protein [Actinomycetaceae bacterium]